MGGISKEKLTAVVQALESAFDLLDGRYANLFFDSTKLSRPLRAEFEPVLVEQIVLEWSGDVGLNVTALKVATTAQSQTLSDLSVTEIQSNSDMFRLDGAGPTTPLAPDDGALKRAVIDIEPVKGGMLLIEQKNGHSVLPTTLNISIQSADGPLKPLYDNAALVKSFSDEIASLPIASRFPRLWRIVTRALWCVLIQDYEGTRTPFSKMRQFVGLDAYMAIGQLLNERWLLAREHEYSQHGVSNTFRFWSAAEKTNFLNDIKILCDALQAEDIESCVCFGTLLGFVRDDDFIPHDDDADILCFNHDKTLKTPGFIAKLAKAGEKAGMKIVKIHNGNGFIRMFTPMGKSVDFFVCDVRDGACHLHPAKHKPTKRDVFFPLSLGQIHGVQLPYPNRPEALLHDIYGEGWVTPVPFFAHNWTRSG